MAMGELMAVCLRKMAEAPLAAAWLPAAHGNQTIITVTGETTKTMNRTITPAQRAVEHLHGAAEQIITTIPAQ